MMTLIFHPQDNQLSCPQAHLLELPTICTDNAFIHQKTAKNTSKKVIKFIFSTNKKSPCVAEFFPRKKKHKFSPKTIWSKNEILAKNN